MSDRVYAVTRSYPDDERYDLMSQTRRAAVSISANIAEGSGRASDSEYRHFIEIASGSLMETISHLASAHRQRLLSKTDFPSLYADCERIGKMLSALRNRLKAKT